MEKITTQRLRLCYIFNFFILSVLRLELFLDHVWRRVCGTAAERIIQNINLHLYILEWHPARFAVVYLPY